MVEIIKSKRGAPYGNRNARKHGYYSRVLTKLEQKDIKKAALVDGIDQEIDLLRLKIKSVIRHDPENVRLIIQAATSLARLLRTRNNLRKTSRETLQQAFRNVINEIALPLGIDAEKLLSIKSARHDQADCFPNKKTNTRSF